MSKRIAYVGLSTPVGYDYKNMASRTKVDTSTSPNPILDSPFGLFLLFDEIWFLTRSLCPQNLRYAPFVKFLDEINQIPFVNQVEIEQMYKEIREKENSMYEQGIYDRRENFDKVIKRVAAGREYGIDNHTHRLQIGDVSLGGNPTVNNLLFDMEVINRLNNPNVELVTNSFTQTWFEGTEMTHFEIEMAEALVIDNIPNYLTLKGPYHPCVEAARENNYLKDFRKWISKRPLHTDRNELLDIKNEVEEAIRKAQDEVFLKHFEPKHHYKSVGKAILGDTIGTFIPGVSAVSTAVEETIKFVNNKDRRWQAFIVSLRNN
ncbi:hypothetical protein [Bacillus cereus]|uniref:Uncharacterized protein n=1 Tax=Bacillus cereus TaxID=1396 RepID=A0A2A8ZUX3_BACCE|nr:hypothetical protein [Bacillus cereus]PFE08589.1 hypothetical protein CN307_27965 [Bacillus cereus]